MVSVPLLYISIPSVLPLFYINIPTATQYPFLPMNLLTFPKNQSSHSQHSRTFPPYPLDQQLHNTL